MYVSNADFLRILITIKLHDLQLDYVFNRRQLQISFSYIFPDSPSELKILPRPIVQSVIEGICIEPGTDNQVPLGCFDTASKYIKGHLTNNVLQTFFDSSAYAKYQV